MKSKVAPITRPHAPVFTNYLATLYYVAGGGTGPWHNFKYVRHKPRAKSWNSYWLAWHTEDKRFADSSSRRAFEEQDPVAYRGVADLLTRRRDLVLRAVRAVADLSDERY